MYVLYICATSMKKKIIQNQRMLQAHRIIDKQKVQSMLIDWFDKARVLHRDFYAALFKFQSSFGL